MMKEKKENSPEQKKLHDQLFEAIQNRDLSAVKTAVEQGASLEATNENGDPPLVAAVESNSLEMVSYLLSCKNIDPNTTGRQKNTALHRAARDGRISILETLLQDLRVDPTLLEQDGMTPLALTWMYSEDPEEKAKAFALLLAKAEEKDPNTIHTWRDHAGRSLLHVVASSKNPKILQLLLEHPKMTPDMINLRGEDGQTALSEAVSAGNLEGVKLLLADPRMEKDAVNQSYNGGNTLLHLAARSGNFDLVQFLLQRTDMKPELLQAVDSDGNTVLWAASGPGHWNLFPLLVQDTRMNGATVNARQGSNTLLHRVVQFGPAALPALQALLAHPDIDPNQTNGDGQTPLDLAATDRVQAALGVLLADPRTELSLPVARKVMWEAARSGNTDLLQKCLTAGINVHTVAEDEFQLTLLHVAAGGGHVAAMQWLYDYGAHLSEDINALAVHGYTPLHLATQGGHLAAVQWLLEHDANVHAATTGGGKHGYTALHFAAELRQEDLPHPSAPTLVQQLVQRGAGPDARETGPNGFTPLHLAAIGGNEAVIWELLAQGADRTVQDTKAHMTAKQYAAQSGAFDAPGLLDQMFGP